MPLLDWLLRKHYEDYAIQSAWANLHLNKAERGLHNRIKKSLELYPCDLLFVHRDADDQPLESRIEEIKAALTHIPDLQKPVVHVIPIRMQEA